MEQQTAKLVSITISCGFQVKQIARNIKAGYEPGRIAINEEIYRQLNNASEPLYRFDEGLSSDISGQFNGKDVLINPKHRSTSVVLHELTHAANRPKLTDQGTYYKDSATSPQEKKIIQIGSPVDDSIYDDLLKNFPELSDMIDYERRYLSIPSEIYARMMQFRKENKLNPRKQYNVKEIEQMMKKSKVGGINMYKPEIFTKLLNEVAQNNPTQQNTEQQTYYAKQGGTFKWYISQK